MLWGEVQHQVRRYPQICHHACQHKATLPPASSRLNTSLGNLEKAEQAREAGANWSAFLFFTLATSTACRRRGYLSRSALLLLGLLPISVSYDSFFPDSFLSSLLIATVTCKSEIKVCFTQI